jgi:hypothetical protein
MAMKSLRYNGSGLLSCWIFWTTQVFPLELSSGRSRIVWLCHKSELLNRVHATLDSLTAFPKDSNIGLLDRVLPKFVDCLTASPQSLKADLRSRGYPPTPDEESGEVGPLARARASGRSRNPILVEEVNRH